MKERPIIFSVTTGQPSQRLLLRELTHVALLVIDAALEEAARVCEELDEEALCKEGRLASGRECAAAIRAMKEQA